MRHSNYCSNSKSYYKIFSTTTLDYWKNYHDSFGVIRAQCELRSYCVFRFVGADSIVNNNDIEHQNIYHDSFAVTHVFSQVYYNGFLKKWLQRWKFSSLFLILYYNKFPKVCGHRATNYCSKWKFTTIYYYVWCTSVPLLLYELIVPKVCLFIDACDKFCLILGCIEKHLTYISRKVVSKDGTFFAIQW